MIRLPRQASTDPLFAAFTQAVERELAGLNARLVNIETTPPSGGGSVPDITGPSVLGRESGTGQPTEIAIGTNLSISGNILSASGGSGQFDSAFPTVDFGAFGSKPKYLVTVAVSATWVTSSSVIVAGFAGNTAEDAIVQEMTASIGTITDGVGFDLLVHSPRGSVGLYTVHCIGV